jgi:hypothetical protein
MAVKRTLLQLINTAQRELGLSQSTSIINNTTDLTAVQMLGFIQAEVEELGQCHNWTILQKEYNLVVNVPITTTGNLYPNSSLIDNIPSTASLAAVNFSVSGNGLPVATRILTVNGATSINTTMQGTVTATVVSASLTFSQDTYPEPSDFNFFQSQTWYDRTNRWRLLGPDSPQQDQFVRSGIVALGPRRHWRQLGLGAGMQGGEFGSLNSYRIWPPPAELVNPLQLVYEYMSRSWIATSGMSSTLSDTWATDNDVCLLDDRAIILGLKWRFWMQKGFGYAQYRADYDMYVERLKARDGGSKTLSLVPRTVPFLVDVTNVQDSNFPSNTNVNSQGT